MKRTIKRLNKALEDPNYRAGWIANIAMAYMDSESSYRNQNDKVNKYLNRDDRHIIANEAAESFLNMLKG